ncbi:MAG: hypothetical protein K2M34_03720 [Alphaproteobacteria bacterium]|nr:hypothetical protein [Alphaproteobacteria bacterium]
MIKKIIAFLFVVLCPLYGFAFELQDLANYQGVAVKVFVESDSLHKTNNSKSVEVQGTRELVRVLGESKVYYNTEFVYMSDTKIELQGQTTWYFYNPKSLNGAKKYKLYYRKNDVTWAGRPNDILVIARQSDNNMLFLIVQKDSPAEQELYNVLGMNAPERQQKSWWQKLWSSSDSRQSEYDIDSTTLPISAVPDTSWMRVYFTPGTDCEDNIANSIDASRKTIDVAVYSITNDKIVNSLIAAHNRGVRVRVISDKLQSAGRASLIGRIRDAGIPVVLNTKHKIMHNKFAIFDGKDVEDGSYNWTSSATQSNAENCVFFLEQNGNFSNQFQYLWDLYSAPSVVSK